MKNLVFKASFSLLFLFIFAFNLRAENIDTVLREHINFFEIKPLEPLKTTSNRAMIDLGRHLFIAPIISGNRDISCRTCHDPSLGTSDGKALSQTHDGKGILQRNSQSLFNVGLSTRVHMFWDGRVTYHPGMKVFTTPEPAFNGERPSRKDITEAMSSALAMQAIFPMVSREEMRGRNGENEIANAKTNLEAWDLIVKRLIKHPHFKGQIEAAYPNIPLEKINIGHMGEALALFINEAFYSNGAPVFRYIKGDLNALSPKEKEGFRLFIEKGKCIACHMGGEFGNNTFYASVGVPQFGARPMALDIGRGAIKDESFKRLFFRVPSLINLAATAPYMHNGAYTSIRDVINHYSNIKIFLESFDLTPERRAEFPVEVEVLSDLKTKTEIYNSIVAPFLKTGLHFTEDEKDALEAFLKTSLMDPSFN